MYCGGCDNIPFWRWLKKNQKFTSVTCNDYDGESLAKLQPNNFTDCFSEYLCTLSFESHKILPGHKLTELLCASPGAG